MADMRQDATGHALNRNMRATLSAGEGKGVVPREELICDFSTDGVDRTIEPKLSRKKIVVESGNWDLIG